MTSIEKLPKILLNDPICRFYHLQIGDVIRFQRNSDCDFYYRTVIE